MVVQSVLSGNHMRNLLYLYSIKTANIYGQKRFTVKWDSIVKSAALLCCRVSLLRKLQLNYQLCIFMPFNPFCNYNM
jgi:hypothetical protein